jgi:hypothetical protein
MKGIYIMSSDALKYLNEIKFGMSRNLNKRLISYSHIFKNCYYPYMYELDTNVTKIFELEKKILNKTKEKKSNYYSPEYRNMEIENMHQIILETLNEDNIKYKINKNYKIIKNKKKMENIHDKSTNEIFFVFNKKLNKLMNESLNGDNNIMAKIIHKNNKNFIYCDDEYINEIKVTSLYIFNNNTWNKGKKAENIICCNLLDKIIIMYKKGLEQCNKPSTILNFLKNLENVDTIEVITKEITKLAINKKLNLTKKLNSNLNLIGLLIMIM